MDTTDTNEPSVYDIISEIDRTLDTLRSYRLTLELADKEPAGLYDNEVASIVGNLADMGVI